MTRRSVLLLLASAVTSTCGGSVQSPTPNRTPLVAAPDYAPINIANEPPPIQGCERDELVAPRGKARLATRFTFPAEPPWAKSDASICADDLRITLSANDKSLFVSLYHSTTGCNHQYERGVSIDRISATVSATPYRAMHYARLGTNIILGYGPKRLESDGIVQDLISIGPISTSVVVRDNAAWDHGWLDPIQSNGELFLYASTSSPAVWWQPSTNKGGKVAPALLPDGLCWMTVGRLFPSRGVVWIREQGNWDCSPGPNLRGLAVEFPSGNGPVLLEGKTNLNFPASRGAELYWADGSSRNAGVLIDDGYHLLDVDYGEIDVSTSQLAAVTRSFILTKSNASPKSFQLELRSREGKLLEADLGSVAGATVAHFHDRYGAYWVTYDDIANEYALWMLDFDFLGCPTD